MQHAAWNGGKMDNWLPAHREADGANGPYVMGYYTRDDIPFQFALAEAFTICDNYHCSVMGPTWPNRLYWMTGTIDPERRRAAARSSTTSTRTAVPVDDLRRARWRRAGVSWKVYQAGRQLRLQHAGEVQDVPGRADRARTLYQSGHAHATPAGQFEYDAIHDRLPAVSWIIPTSYQSEHPDYMPAAGADFVASKIDAIAANPDVWAKTVFILNYDENDGLFDHVRAADRRRPARRASSSTGLPIGGGFRVPCIIVSPWTRGRLGRAARPSTTPRCCSFLEKLTGVDEPNISAWRRADLRRPDVGVRCRQGAAGSRALPGTKAQLARAVKEVTTLPAPVFPGANQTPPVQQAGHRPRPRNTTREA